ncbi:MAG: ankyrin repeat domain-containing protein [bacterium]|nr:ankyrin repeat domain-containing protein [bacterium]
MKIPLLDDGRIDQDTMRDQVDWSNLSAFESIILTYLDIDWNKLSREIKEHPEIAKLSWGENETLLGIAANDNQFEIVKLLVESGADINNRNKYGTPIFAAVWSGNPEIVDYLIKKGVGGTINCGCQQGWTPLHKAARKGYLDIVKLLIQAGADVNSIDNIGSTPLDHAATFGFSDVANFLIKHHAKYHKPETQIYMDSIEPDK